MSVCNGDYDLDFGEQVPNIEYEGKLIPRYKSAEECKICTAKKNQAHFYGCENERCPSCGGQLVWCDCYITDDGTKHFE